MYINNNPNIDNTMYIRDWRKSLRSPLTYRIGNRSIRYQIIWIILFFSFILFIFIYVNISTATNNAYTNINGNSLNFQAPPPPKTNIYSYSSSKQSNNVLPTVAPINYYNNTYPLTNPIVMSGIKKFRIGIIADLDTNSLCTKKKNTWKSYLKKGFLIYSSLKGSVSVVWDQYDPIELTSSFSLKGTN